MLDNIGVLRQLTPAVAQSNRPPVHARRTRVRSVSRGVTIDYYLKQAAEKVTIEILDAQGQRGPHVHRDGRAEAETRRPEAPAAEEAEGPRARRAAA